MTLDNTDFIGLTPQEIDLWHMFAPTAKELGLELVDINVSSATTPVLEIWVDKENATIGNAINLDECAHLSRRLGRLLDVEETFAMAFNLEVSSPGIERPYATKQALQNAVGKSVKVKLAVPIGDDTRKLKGELKAITETEITIGEDTTELTNIRTIKRTLTEAELQDIMKPIKGGAK